MPKTNYNLFHDRFIYQDICAPMTQQFYGVMKDKVISLPPDVGTGYFRYISPCKHMELYISDVTFHKKTILSERAYRDSYSVSFCISDTLEWGNPEVKSHISLDKGECCIYGNGSYRAENYYEADRRYVGIGLELHPCRFQSVTDCLLQKKAVSEFGQSASNVQKFKATRTVESILHQIIRCNYIDSLKSIYLEGKILELASAFANEVILERDLSSIQNELSVSDDATLIWVCQLIDENYAEPLTISELARKSYMSESKLRAGFKQQFGTTIYQYVLDKRMEKARELLEQQNCMVRDAASMVGYSNMSHFSENFRKKFGFNPSEYIKSYQK